VIDQEMLGTRTKKAEKAVSRDDSLSSGELCEITEKVIV